MRRNYLWYQFFRYIIVRPSIQLYFSDLTVSGTRHIPDNKPVIFVGNHQNSFIDALHIVTTTHLFIHFLTRAEPFEAPFLGSFLRSLNMVPVYRVRDGFSSIKKNEATFEHCFRQLKKNDGVLVFAEANHDLKRRVRSFSKGFTRIAFGAEERYDWELDLQVIPVGISYGRHQKARTPVHVEYGRPIPVSRYKGTYLEDENKAAQQLKKSVSSGLKNVTMHVQNLDHYPLYHILLDELEPNRPDLLRPEIVNSRVAQVKKHLDEDLVEKARELTDEADSRNVKLHDFIAPARVSYKDLFFSPFYLFSLVNNLIPYQAVRWLTQDYIEDHVFDASAKFLSGLVLFPIYYLLVTAVLGLTGVGGVALAGYFLLSLATAPLFVRAKDLVLTNSAKKLQQENPEAYRFIKKQLDHFADLRNKILDKEQETG